MSEFNLIDIIFIQIIGSVLIGVALVSIVAFTQFLKEIVYYIQERKAIDTDDKSVVNAHIQDFAILELFYLGVVGIGAIVQSLLIRLLNSQLELSIHFGSVVTLTVGLLIFVVLCGVLISHVKREYRQLSSHVHSVDYMTGVIRIAIMSVVTIMVIGLCGLLPLFFTQI